MKKILAGFIGAAAMLIAQFAFAAPPTQKDAQALVEKAAAYVKANGKEKWMQEIAASNSEWVKPELYVFAYDLTGTLVSDPNPKLIGKNMYEVPDVDGKLFRKEIIDTAKSKGSGWVDYKFKNPTTGNIQAKTAYFQKVNDIVLVSGIYKN
jgi:cytochrome c